ncbi:MAG: ATP-dependent helicase, partial [Halieaceae bacterium]|nr:ATP-dependent helicase [Halieaceae bacterium]
MGKGVHSATLGDAFARSVGEGLFSLAATKSDTDLSPSVRYWRNFASKYLSERCLMPQADPQQPEPIEPLTATETLPLLMSAPPMHGAEYLSAEVLHEIRTTLDDWVCAQIRANGGLDALLVAQAPQWHQVGRVCFHLAENKNDPEFPFAFMATYAPELSEDGRVRHQPLSRALQEYAGAKNKKALIRLLSPVHLAAQSSPVIKDL